MYWLDTHPLQYCIGHLQFCTYTVLLTHTYIPVTIPTSVLSILYTAFPAGALQDEIFHVPQVQAYCAGNFSRWDPMITTLPGLYSVSWITITILERTLAAVGLLSEVGPNSVLCSTPYLRGQNVVFLAAVFALLYKIMVLESEQDQTQSASGTEQNKELPNRDVLMRVLEAFNLSMFPVLFFFSCLYYTDMGATCFVLLGYYQALNGQHVSSALVSVVQVHTTPHHTHTSHHINGLGDQ